MMSRALQFPFGGKNPFYTPASPPPGVRLGAGDNRCFFKTGPKSFPRFPFFFFFPPGDRKWLEKEAGKIPGVPPGAPGAPRVRGPTEGGGVEGEEEVDCPGEGGCPRC